MNESEIMDAIVALIATYTSYPVTRGGVLAVDSISVTAQGTSVTPDMDKNLQGKIDVTITAKTSSVTAMLAVMNTIINNLNALKTPNLPTGVLAINQMNAPELVGRDETANNNWLIGSSVEIIYGKGM